MEQVYLWIRAGGGAVDSGGHISASMKRRALLQQNYGVLVWRGDVRRFAQLRLITGLIWEMQPDSWMMKNHLSSAAFINNEPLELPADAQLNWVLENSFLWSDWRMELVHAQEVPSDPEEKSNFCSHSCSSRTWFSQKRLVNWLQAHLPQSFDPYLILALEHSITPPPCYQLSTFVIAD